MSSIKQAVIISAVRTPVGKLLGALKSFKATDLGAIVVREAVKRAGVKPEDGALVLELMHFADALVDSSSLKVPGEVSLGAKELDMAEELIGRMEGKWDPEKYTDDYSQALLELIQKKIESGGKELPGAPPAKRAPGKVIDLVSVLQESLQQTGKGGKKKARPAAHHRKTALKKAA